MSPSSATETLARQLGIDFEDPELLEAALTHPSYAVEHGGQDYQRLEFLGDSILGLVIAQMLYARFPDLPEGDLTRMKNALVRGRVLAELSDELGITGAIRLGEGSLKTGVRERASVREAAFEAVVAAVYLSCGIDVTAEFVQHALGERVDAKTLLEAVDDPKTRLQEVAQALGLGLPSYRVVDRSGPPHQPTFTAQVSAGRVTSLGSGSSKQAAEQEAAAGALHALESTPE
jgi:ribonuclease III